MTQTAERIRLELPFPPKELSPNSRVHWRQKAKVIAEYRQDCGWASKPSPFDDLVWWREHTPLKPPVRATVTFVVPDRRKRDMDNLLAMLKPAWDGLTDAGLLEGDDSERFSVERAVVQLVSHGELCRKMQYRGFAGTPNARAKCTCDAKEPCVIVELWSEHG